MVVRRQAQGHRRRSLFTPITSTASSRDMCSSDYFVPFRTVLMRRHFDSSRTLRRMDAGTVQLMAYGFKGSVHVLFKGFDEDLAQFHVVPHGVHA